MKLKTRADRIRMIQEVIFIDLGCFLAFIHQSLEFPQSTALEKLHR